ncbi:DNA-directed RNA polymerase subunit beta, partial [Mycobacterium tuberculosis]|nr:DNA-directed RNA polymerase subunit beta [Mycobacterium tuberculosis]
VSAPGALWRLYALREWIVTAPREVSDLFDLGLRRTTDGIGLEEILAGVEIPAGPDEVARTIDEILVGAFRGDVVIALLRAAAFVGICAA